MYLAILDILDAIEAFMNRGGPVLTIIMGLLLIKWSLVFERIWYINTIPVSYTHLRAHETS